MSIIAQIATAPAHIRAEEKDLERFHAAAFYQAELASLSKTYSRVDLADADLPYAMVHTYLDGKLTTAYHLQATPMPHIIMHPGFGRSSLKGKDPVQSYFFESEEDAVLFRMKYEGKRND